MTDPARAAVEAWMNEECPHESLYRAGCPDCLLAFAAAQRKEEQMRIGEELLDVDLATIEADWTPEARECASHLLAQVANNLFARGSPNRARREGPGGAK